MINIEMIKSALKDYSSREDANKFSSEVVIQCKTGDKWAWLRCQKTPGTYGTRYISIWAAEGASNSKNSINLFYSDGFYFNTYPRLGWIFHEESKEGRGKIKEDNIYMTTNNKSKVTASMFHFIKKIFQSFNERRDSFRAEIKKFSTSKTLLLEENKSSKDFIEDIETVINILSEQLEQDIQKSIKLNNK